MNTTGSKIKNRVISGAVGAVLLVPISATGAFAQDSTDAIVEQAIEHVEAPVQEAPIEAAPVEVAPEPAPEPVVEAAPVTEAPAPAPVVEEAPAPKPVEPPAPAPEPAPVEVAPEPVVAPEPAPAPVETPVEPAPAPAPEPAPSQSAAPVAEVEETAPVEKAPVEETPVQDEAPAETPVEEAPVAEPVEEVTAPDDTDITETEGAVDETSTDGTADVEAVEDTVETGDEVPQQTKSMDDLTPEEREEGELIIGGSVNINPWVDFDKLFLERINDIREENGLNRLEQAGDLYEESLSWSEEMAAEGVLAHDPDVFDDISNAQCLNGGGENVYWSSMMGSWEGNTDFMVDRTIASYMDSPGHRENILRPEFTHHMSATVTGLADNRGQVFNTHRFGANCNTLSLEAAVAGLGIDDNTGDAPSDYDGEQTPPNTGGDNGDTDNGDDTDTDTGNNDAGNGDDTTGNNGGDTNTGTDSNGGTNDSDTTTGTGTGSNAGGNDTADNNAGNTVNDTDTGRETGTLDNDGNAGANDSTGMNSGVGVVSDDLITNDGAEGADATENGEDTLADAGAENAALAGVGFGAVLLGLLAVLFGRRKPQTDL